jgi:hypothetical protein
MLMRLIKILIILCWVALIVSLFFPWVGVESKGVEISGFSSKGTSVYGKPGLFHLILAGIFIVFLFIDKVWSKRIAYFFGALNVAWAIRNFSIISACSGGICPEKYAAVYVLLFSAVIMFVLSLFVDYGREVSSE